MEIIAAETISNVLLNWVWPVAQFIIGLGLVVFVHELGHFMVAKFVDIKVERFALGFGPRLIGFQKGETDYCINVIPLGGYVKMLGQEDFKPESGELPDPRAFNNKSVGARFAVVAAGVIMNVIFAAIAFVVVSMVGMKASAPVIGSVLPGSPASAASITWSAPIPADAGATTTPATSTQPEPTKTIGLLPGDKVVRIQSDSFFVHLMSEDVEDFLKIAYSAILAGPDDKFKITVERPIGGKTYTGVADLGVRPLPTELGTTRPGFGIGPAITSTIAIDDERIIDSPFKAGDQITAVNGQPVQFIYQIHNATKALDAPTVELTVLRDGQKLQLPVTSDLHFRDEVFHLRTGGWILATTSEAKGENVVATLADGNTITFPQSDIIGGNIHYENGKLRPGSLEILGMIPRTVITAVSEGSPAQTMGLRPGDVVRTYGDEPMPTIAQIQEINRNLAGKGTSLVIERDGNALPQAWIVPKLRNGVVQMGISPGVDQLHTVAGHIQPDSPAGRAGLMPGDAIEAINGKPVHSWADTYLALKGLAGQQVSIQCRRGLDVLSADMGVIDANAFPSQAYQLAILDNISFRPLDTTIIHRNPLKAISWGVSRTWEFVIMQYGTLRQLAAGRVGGGEISGPVGIGGAAVKFARQGPIEMLYFMAFISAALAVVNFLPFPVVDGGLAVFLIIEKFRGRPLPPKLMWIIQVIGLVILGGVFILLTWNDIMRWVRGMW